MPERHPTATRLIKVALALFVDRGVDGTPIVRIEEAAGLAPGSGAFYKHFRSKQALLDAAIADAGDTTRAGDHVFELLAGMTLDQQAEMIVRATWLSFDAHRDLFLVLARQPEARPAGFAEDPSAWPGNGPAFVARWLRSFDGAIDDPDALAVLLLDALAAFWRHRQTTTAPYGVDADRFVATWVGLVRSAVAPSGRRRPRRAPG
ncbi:MAG TPA: helix-turn-helix domain-containing protein [Acidimicrobiales bacterium]|nr:helix-turn-helix domain-containing protein [Acidimicrobiales bacterium]